MRSDRTGQVQVVVMRPHGEDYQVLILHRVPAKGAFWQPITGGIKPGEAVREALSREVYEEIGLPAPHHVVDLDFQFSFTEDTGTLTEQVFAIVVDPDFEPTISDEHDEYRWCSLDEALKTVKFDTVMTSLTKAFASLRARS